MVRTITLANRALDTDSLKAILPAPLSPITTLDLSRNMLGDESISHLSRRPHNKLRAINVTHNNLGNQSLVALLNGLNFPSLEHLAIGHNGVDEGGPAMLNNHDGFPPLTRLQIGGNLLGASGFDTLMTLPWFSELRALGCTSIMRSECGPGGLTRVLQAAPLLEHLDLSSNPLMDHLCDSMNGVFPSQPKLKTLLLRHCKLTSEGLEALGMMGDSWLCGVTHLDLSYNRIGDRGALQLINTSWLPNLTALNLTANRISADVISRIAHSDLAKRVDIRLEQELSWQGILNPS